MISPFECCLEVPFRRLAFIAIAWLASASGLQAQHSLLFDGTNDYVTFGPAPALGSQTFTIETWFRRIGTGVSTTTGLSGVTAIPLVAKGRGEADGNAQDMNYFLGIRATDGVLVADFEEGASGASPGLNHPIVGVTPVSSGVWHHAAATYDGAKWQLFLDGVLETEVIVNQPPRADSIQHASLASALNSTGAASGFFHGALDEVRIWSSARTAQEIAASRDAEILSAPGLVGRWGLNEGSGTVAGDTSESAVQGTLTNGPRWTAGFQEPISAAVTRGPYLQLGTPTSVILRWRTDVATDSRVQFGAAAETLSATVDDSAVTTEHRVQLTGLTSDTQYFYSVGSRTATLARGADYTFFTAPPIGAAHPTRIWVLGDSGTADSVAASVRNGYATFNGSRYTDVWLMLGDNAYNNGTDGEYQAAVFNMYPSYLRQSVLWSTIGNHDTAFSTNPSPTIPYFQIFDNPTNGEAGGIPSGTEKYYSFDYGQIHFICLDSMTSNRLANSPMLTWLEEDLASTTQQWIIAFWHHPPYTKGSHNSDTEIELVQMRQNALPILEAGGVDLVLAGHSHSYERSFLINGHYGTSNTMNAAMKLDRGSGREAETGAYGKPGGLAANQGAVYAVAGNGGHVTYWVGGSTAEFNPTPHPAMFYSALHVGSMVLDVDGHRLEAKMIRETGAVDDYFTIVKNVPNVPPTVAIMSPAPGAAFASPASITITAAASDEGGTVRQVEFFADGTRIGVATGTSPYSVHWQNAGVGEHTLTVTAFDNLGAQTTSTAVKIMIDAASLPAPPEDLAAAAGNAKVSLTWRPSAGTTSYTVKRSSRKGDAYSPVANGITSTGYVDTRVVNGRGYFYVVTASNVAGESANSNQAAAVPRLRPPPAPRPQTER